MSVARPGEVYRLLETRQTVQASLFDKVREEFTSGIVRESDTVGYFLVYLLSGRALLANFKNLGEVPARSRDLFRVIMERTPRVESIDSAAASLCKLEVKNEVVEGQYENALIIATHGVTYWPTDAELRQLRGIVRLAIMDVEGAYNDLSMAGVLDSKLLWIRESTHFAEQRFPDRRDVSTEV
jgi:hypothetical protein